MSKELLKALLDYDFYDKFKSKLSSDSFQDSNAKWIFQTIQENHEKHAKTINIQELKALHYAFNPAITQATKASLALLFDELEKLDISSSVGEELVLAQYKLNQFTALAQLAMDGGDNKEVSLEKLQRTLDNIKEAARPPAAVEEYVTDDIEELLNEVSREYKWKMHLPALSEVVGGVGEGVFGLIAARPNAGKSAMCVSLICQPGGFADQGARVHYIGNEEKVARTKVRAYSAYTGMTKDELAANKPEAQRQWNKIKDNIKFKDVVGMGLTDVENYVKLNPMDILFIDQLDKIRLEGSFAADHERIRTLYTYTRELAKKYNIAIFGVCQASNDAEGKLYFGFEALEGSKTGKAAEVDLCICIGKDSYNVNQGVDTGFRMANVVKNKLTGIEQSVGFVLERNLSRIIS